MSSNLWRLIPGLCALALSFSAAGSLARGRAEPSPITRVARSTSTHRFALGVELGDPSAITGKYWLNNTNAVDFALGFWLSEFFLIDADFLHHFPGAFGRSNEFTAALAPYVGIGGLLAFVDSSLREWPYGYEGQHSPIALGIRVPLGIEWLVRGAPLGVFVELVPGLGLLPGTFTLFNGGLGIRYYF